MQVACAWPFILLESYVTKPGGIDTDDVNQQTLCSGGHDAIAQQRYCAHRLLKKAVSKAAASEGPRRTLVVR